jgi:hypothetical protein
MKSSPPLAAAVKVALIGLAYDGDSGVLVILVAGRSIVGRVASGGSDGQDSGDNELYKKI